jgi:hypothetical protein
MEVLSRGDLRQLVRQARAGVPWERLRSSVPNVRPEYLDENWKGWVASTVGPPQASVAEAPAPLKKRRKKV